MFLQVEEFSHFQVFGKVLFWIETCDLFEIFYKVRLVVKAPFKCYSRKIVQFALFDQFQHPVKTNDPRQHFRFYPYTGDKVSCELSFPYVQGRRKFVDGDVAVSFKDSVHQLYGNGAVGAGVPAFQEKGFQYVLTLGSAGSRNYTFFQSLSGGSPDPC